MPKRRTTPNTPAGAAGRRFHVAHLRPGDFRAEGLRSFFEYPRPRHPRATAPRR
jgi:hypothetical protein